ncbi:MAG TPA: M1 family metallopeptidase [Acidobacteriota bacterium]|nr:M1 family metallopeptidase [Acidobacteriota bacterium]
MFIRIVAFLGTLASSLTPTISSAASDVYWQQEVNYVLDVTLQDDLRTITGEVDIEYINNSPDALDVIYLKAFPNAIQRGSYADLKRRYVNDFEYADLKPKEEGSLRLYERSGAARAYRSFETDNTIITVTLSTPLSPGDTAHLAFSFTTVLPEPASMRMGVDSGTTKAAYWYPQACVYDHKVGWVNSQYLGWGECYGDYGRFDVRITAPADQIVAATGVLVNEDEVLPDSLRALLDIRNYQRPRSEWPKLEPDTTSTRTWHYVAENVNDFAWTASNNFCLDTDTTNGVEVIVYALRHRAEDWTRAVMIGRQAIETFSELYCPYRWPVIRICDAFSGMEYPMLTNCSGEDDSPWFDLLLYHEIGHQWFMGQVGSNQVDRPFLDESFTTHLEHNAMEKYLGRHGNLDDFTNWYQRWLAPSEQDREVRGFLPLLLLMKEGMDRPMVGTSYDRGREYWPNRVSAYYKGAAMHYSLRSVLGDSLYYAAMRRYCADWLFRHPYEDDYTRSMENATGIELDNFLDQWYYGRDRLDYAFTGKESRETGRGMEHTVKLERKADFVSPVDVAVIWEQGDTTFYTVAPEGMAYAKPGYVLLPTWHQFRRVEPAYRFTVKANRKIRKVVVDPYNLLMDIDRRNNQSGLFWPTEVRFDNLLYDRTPANRYALRLRPDIWYDEPNGVQAGFHAHGSYLETESRFSLDLGVGTESARPFVDFSWSDLLGRFGPRATTGARVLRSDRRMFFSWGLEKRFREWYSRPDQELLFVQLDYLRVGGGREPWSDAPSDEISRYLPDPTWDVARVARLHLGGGFLRTFRYGSYYFYNRNEVSACVQEHRRRSILERRFLAGVSLIGQSRTYLSVVLEGLVTNGEPPSQYLRHISRIRSIDRFVHSRLFRSPGTVPADWENHLYAADPRVRGYQDRNLYLIDYFGASIECTPPDLLPFRWFKILPLVGGFLSQADQTVFAEGGWLSFDDRESSYREPVASNETLSFEGKRTFIMSAGVSIALPAVWRQHRVRVDFPLYLNKPAAGEDEADFRVSVAWLLPLHQRDRLP